MLPIKVLAALGSDSNPKIQLLSLLGSKEKELSAKVAV
jgi:hypothetical protein